MDSRIEPIVISQRVGTPTATLPVRRPGRWQVADPLRGRSRSAGIGALLLTAIGVGCLGYLQVRSGVGGMVSDYGFSGSGRVLLPAAMLAMAGALWLCRHGLTAAHAAGSPARALLVTAAVGLVLMSGFPSDATGTRTSAAGTVHKTAAALLFCALPAAALVLARGFVGRPEWRGLAAPVGRMGVTGVVTMVGFLGTYLPGFGVPLPGGRLLTQLEGPAERLVLLPDLALVVILGLRLAVVRPGGYAARAGVECPTVPATVPVP